MRGVVLAGGLGKRLGPLTRITNKHLLPVYDRPMIFYPIQTLIEAGITDILIVTGGNHAGEFLRLLRNGEEFGLGHVNFQYTYQMGEAGIAAALSLAERFAQGEPLVVILGDNVLQDRIGPSVARFASQGAGAKILLKEVDEPQRFGVAQLQGKRLVRILEKPAKPPSRLAVTGVYMYDAQLFDIIKTLKPSARGELEITDVNNAYIQRSQMTYEVLTGWWTDCGLPETLYRAATLVRQQAMREERRGAAVSSSRKTAAPRSRSSSRASKVS